MARKRMVCRAFTLTEAIVAAVLSVGMLAMIMMIVVMQVRLAASTGNYAEMNEQNRRILTQFDNDMRAAASVSSWSATKVVATVITGMSGGVPISSKIEYRYDAAAKKLWRVVNDSSTTAFVTGVESGGFTYFNKDDALLAPDTGRPLEIKKIMLNLKLTRPNSQASNTDYVVSAIVVMRSRPTG